MTTATNESPTPVSKTTILVVEDEALIADDLQRTLTRLGYSVPVLAATADEAVAAAERLRPSLVLLDIKLRGKRDGIDAGGEIRSRLGLPIIYLTSHSDDATFARAKLTAPHGYILKPFQERDVRIAVEIALHKHEIESRLAVRERWFSTTLRSIGDAVIATDQNAIITFTNAVAQRLTGWGPEAIGRRLDEVFQVFDQTGARIEHPLRVALEASFTLEAATDRRLALRNGTQIPIDENVAPIIDEGGAFLGGVVVFRDITERRQLEQRIAQSERLASLGTMAAGMAHEINNPLAYVIANLDLTIEEMTTARDAVLGAGDEARDTELARKQMVRTLTDALESIGDARAGADRVRHLVRDLRHIGRVDDPARKILDLPEVLEEALKMTDHSTRHCARVRRFFGTTPFVLASDSELGQVFTNLLVNAAQAIGDGNAEANEIVISTYADASGQAVVEVLDTGPGIPSEVLPRLFDPFYSTKPRGAGMGLGLSICHNIVTSLGGALVASNAPAGGALFRVTLPAARPFSAEPSSTTTSVAVSGGRRGKVLVVDDEAAVARAVERTLAGAHDVTATTDGHEALRLLAAGSSFDVILCDVMMPNLSGIDLHATVLRDNPAQAARFVFMTGGTFTERTSRYLEKMPNTQVTKPFDLSALRQLVRSYVTE